MDLRDEDSAFWSYFHWASYVMFIYICIHNVYAHVHVHVHVDVRQPKLGSLSDDALIVCSGSD